MDTTRAITAAGVFLSLSLITPVAFAQNPGTAQEPPPGAATEPAQPPEKAPQAPGLPNAATAESLAQTTALKIHEARREGRDVHDAEAQEKQGEAALRAGFKSEALEHFRRAEISLNEQSKTGNSDGGSSGSSTAAPAAESH